MEMDFAMLWPIQINPGRACGMAGLKAAGRLAHTKPRPYHSHSLRELCSRSREYSDLIGNCADALDMGKTSGPAG